MSTPWMLVADGACPRSAILFVKFRAKPACNRDDESVMIMLEIVCVCIYFAGKQGGATVMSLASVTVRSGMEEGCAVAILEYLGKQLRMVSLLPLGINLLLNESLNLFAS